MEVAYVRLTIYLRSKIHVSLLGPVPRSERILRHPRQHSIRLRELVLALFLQCFRSKM